MSTPFAGARLLTTNEAAAYLRVNRSTVRRLVLNGSLPCLTRSFKSWRIDRQDLDAFIEREKVVAL
jgi:excisionase family DNA binding protein